MPTSHTNLRSGANQTYLPEKRMRLLLTQSGLLDTPSRASALRQEQTFALHSKADLLSRIKFEKMIGLAELTVYRTGSRPQ